MTGPIHGSDDRFEGFRLLEVLGRGGSGTVFRAIEETLGREVALKVLDGHALDPSLAREKFERGARVGAAVDDPGIVGVLRSGQWNGTPFVAMELVRGPTVTRLLSERRLAPVEGLRLAAAIARALHALHAAGFVHGDVKPSNVLLDEDRGGRPRLVDFGLARAIGTPGSGGAEGTPAYMAPEQARGDVAEATTDVFGVGAVLYHALTGRAPFDGRAARAPVRTLAPEVAPDAAAICERAMEPEPSRRYGSALELAEDVDRFLRGVPTRARPLGRAGRLRKFLDRHRVGTVAVAGLALAAAGWRLGGLAVEARRRVAEVAARERLASEIAALGDEARSYLEVEGRGRDEIDRARGRYAPEAVDELVRGRPATEAASILAAYPRERIRSGFEFRSAEAARREGDDPGWAEGLVAAYSADPRGPWGRRALLEIGTRHRVLGRHRPARAAFESYLAGPAVEGVERGPVALWLAEALLELGEVGAAGARFREALEAGLPDPADRRRAELGARLCARIDGEIGYGSGIGARVTAADLDGDRRAEVLVIEGKRLAIVRLEEGRLQEVLSFEATEGPVRTAHPVRFGHGGLPHVLWAERSDEGRDIVHLARYEPGEAALSEVWRAEVLRGPAAQAVADADFDGDGSYEVAYALDHPGRRIVLLSEGPDGIDARPILEPVVGFRGPRRSDTTFLRAADLDGDGRPELVAAVGPWNHWTVSVHRSSREGVVDRPRFLSMVGEVQGGWAGDLDGDGRDEVVLRTMDPRRTAGAELVDSLSAELPPSEEGSKRHPEFGAGLFILEEEGGRCTLTRVRDGEGAGKGPRAAIEGAILDVEGDRLVAVDPAEARPPLGTRLSLPAVPAGMADLDGDGDCEILLRSERDGGSLLALGTGEEEGGPRTTPFDLEAASRAEALQALGHPGAALRVCGEDEGLLHAELLVDLGRPEEAIERLARLADGADPAVRQEALWRWMALAERRRDDEAVAGLARRLLEGSLSADRREVVEARLAAAQERLGHARSIGLEDILACPSASFDPLLVRRSSRGIEVVVVGRRPPLVPLEVRLEHPRGSFSVDGRVRADWLRFAGSLRVEWTPSPEPLLATARDGPAAFARIACGGGGTVETYDRGIAVQWLDPRPLSRSRLEATRKRVPEDGYSFRIESLEPEREVVVSAAAAGQFEVEDRFPVRTPTRAGPCFLRLVGPTDSPEVSRFVVQELRVTVHREGALVGSTPSDSARSSADRAFLDGHFVRAGDLYERLAASERDRELLLRAAIARERGGDPAAADRLVEAADRGTVLRFLETHLGALTPVEDAPFRRPWATRDPVELAATARSAPSRSERYLASAALLERRPEDLACLELHAEILDELGRPAEADLLVARIERLAPGNLHWLRRAEEHATIRGARE